MLETRRTGCDAAVSESGAATPERCFGSRSPAPLEALFSQSRPCASCTRSRNPEATELELLLASDSNESSIFTPLQFPGGGQPYVRNCSTSE